jgi:carotenoid cleavage dioxygenase
VRTPLLGRGDILGGGGSGPPGGANNSSNTSVVSYGGRLLSLQEVGFPYELSAADLGTIGPFDFGGTLTTAMTAHPKRDPATGLLHSFGYGFVPPFLTYHVSDPSGVVLRSEVVDVGASTMIHDFAITEQDVVFWELPVLFDLQAALRGELPFRWDPSYGARVGVMPLGGPATAMRWVEVPPVYVFHGTNAWREGEDVVLDVSVLATMFRDGGDGGPLGLHRWRIGTGGQTLTFSSERLTERHIDLPTIDPRRLGRAHRYAYYVPTRDELGGFEFGGVVAWDAARQRADVWDPGQRFAGGEPLFVPDGPGEADGWVLVFVYDKAEGTSHLALFDATAVAAGPVARVRLPRRVPFGFHGCWIPS